MGILSNRAWLIKITGLLVVICLIAGGFFILKSANVLDYISEVSANITSHEIINNDQENTNLIASNSHNSEYLSNTSFDSLGLKDPYIEQQWALERIKATDLWQVIGGNSGISIAILDTGIDIDHEDLAGIVIAEVNFTDSPTMDDINGHGTHIAGIIAANRNDKGIAGLASGVYLMNVKVADDAGRCQATDVARGIVWAVDNGAKVINISLELTEQSEDLSKAVEYAWNKGALILAAAGNNASDVPVYPAGYEDTIAVAALTIDNCLAPLSNHGGWVDIAAPGMNIYSLLPDNKYGYKTGTSFATAYVSGLAAELFNIAVDLNGNGCINDEVRYAIESSCDKIGIEEIGNGCIDAAAALAVLQ